jgi:hypothetical protein
MRRRGSGAKALIAASVFLGRSGGKRQEGETDIIEKIGFRKGAPNGGE